MVTSRIVRFVEGKGNRRANMLGVMQKQLNRA